MTDLRGGIENYFCTFAGKRQEIRWRRRTQITIRSVLFRRWQGRALITVFKRAFSLHSWWLCNWRACRLWLKSQKLNEMRQFKSIHSSIAKPWRLLHLVKLRRKYLEELLPSYMCMWKQIFIVFFFFSLETYPFTFVRQWQGRKPRRMRRANRGQAAGLGPQDFNSNKRK